MLRFEKIPYKQFCEDMTKVYGSLTEEFLKNIYDSIKLPRRATGWSAGYDFYALIDETIYPESQDIVLLIGWIIEKQGSGTLSVWNWTIVFRTGNLIRNVSGRPGR